MKAKTLAQFEYLIIKTITYLDFHSDDTAKDLVKQWQQVSRQIQHLKQTTADKVLPSEARLLDRHRSRDDS